MGKARRFLDKIVSDFHSIGLDLKRCTPLTLAVKSVENEPGLSQTQLYLTNYDLKPVEPERRQWGPWNFVGFWIADSFNINTWMISSSMIIGGLSWWQSWICVWVGYLIAACFICSTGRIGATYHIGFPAVGRASFGIWGSLWPVLNRVAMACIWYGVQSWIGGECVYLMIRAIWNSFANVPDTLHVKSMNGTNYFIAFILFWVGSLPFLYVPVHKIRHLFTVKAFFVPAAGIAFFIWAIVKAGGIGPIIHQPSKLHGSALAWQVISGIMSSIANFATLIVNVRRVIDKYKHKNVLTDTHRTLISLVSRRNLEMCSGLSYSPFHSASRSHHSSASS